jgi:hypothetical protein
VGGLALVFSFVKVNGQTFHYFLLNVIQSFRRPALRVWKKDYSVEELNYFRNLKPEEVELHEVIKPVKASRIRDLSLTVNTGGFYKPEE